MSRLALRLDRLEALVPTPALLDVWQGILQQVAADVALDPGITEALCAAVQARQAARRLPRLVPLEEASVLSQDALLEIEAHLPDPCQRSAFRTAASEACMAAARRYGYCSPEED